MNKSMLRCKDEEASGDFECDHAKYIAFSVLHIVVHISPATLIRFERLPAEQYSRLSAIKVLNFRSAVLGSLNISSISSLRSVLFFCRIPLSIGPCFIGIEIVGMARKSSVALEAMSEGSFLLPMYDRSVLSDLASSNKTRCRDGFICE